MRINIRDLAEKQTREIVYVVKGGNDLSQMQFEFISDSVRQVLGYTPKEFKKIPDLWHSIIHPHDIDNFKSSLQKIREQRQSLVLTYRMLDKRTQEYHLIEDFITIRSDEIGDHFIGNAYDITDRMPLCPGDDAVKYKVALEVESTAHVNKLLRTLSDVNQLIIREKDRGKLLHDACRIIVRDCGYLAAWIGVLDEVMTVVRPVAWHTDENTYLNKSILEESLNSKEDSPVLTTIHTGKSAVINNLSERSHKAGRVAKWMKHGEENGFRSVGSFPIHIVGKVAGTLTVVSSSLNAFGSDELRLFSELAEDLGFAMWTFDVQAKERAANETLLNERLLLKTLIDNLPSSVYVKDTECRTKLINASGIRNRGKEHESEVIGKTDFDFFSEEFAEQLYQDDISVINAGKVIVNKRGIFLR
jgi:PAS domain-containing protein